MGQPSQNVTDGDSELQDSQPKLTGCNMIVDSVVWMAPGYRKDNTTAVRCVKRCKDLMPNSENIQTRGIP